jgi:ABC-2 type transport system permease protein
VVLGKVLGCALLSTLQGAVLLPLALTEGAEWAILPLASALACLFLLSFTLSAMGFWLAWRIESAPGFHTVMNLILLPLWMASGALFPTGNSPWLSALSRVDPFTYGVAGVRRGLFPGQDLSDPSFATCLVVLTVLSVIFFLLSSALVSRSRESS